MSNHSDCCVFVTEGHCWLLSALFQIDQYRWGESEVRRIKGLENFEFCRVSEGLCDIDRSLKFSTIFNKNWFIVFSSPTY